MTLAETPREIVIYTVAAIEIRGGGSAWIAADFISRRRAAGA